MTSKIIRKIISTISILTFVFGTLVLNPLTATAAQMTAVKDTMSTQATSATATHVITSTLVGANTLATGETIIYDFVSADFSFNAPASWQITDFTLNDGTNRVNPVAVGAAPSCSAGANNYTVTVDDTTETFTVTTCASWTVSGAAPTIVFTVNGTTATGTGTMTNKATDVGSSQFSITETTDSATGAIAVEDLSVVSVTATVDPTLTFTNSDATVGFGTLTSGAARYANGAASGSASRVAAHNIDISTNASSGYTLTYNGATLTGPSTIPAATIAGSATGTPGTSQFALAGTETTSVGTASMTSSYDAATPNWNFVASTTSQIASSVSGAVSDIDIEYIANISGAQTAGAYSTSLTYIATGNF